MQYKPWPYQIFTTQHIIDNPAAGALLDMGLGKTVSTLTAIDILINRNMEVNKVLVVAPKRVTETVWYEETQKWDHLKHLRVVKVTGNETQRKMALMQKADVYLISVDNFAWLVGLYGTGFPFDMCVIDESSLFKNHKSKRFTMMKMIRPLVKRVVILTGTPAPNGLTDLWSQIYMLDRGVRLGEMITAFREKYFVPDKMQGYQVFKYRPREGGEKMIYDAIGDICVSMKSEDHLDLPDCIYNTVKVPISAEARRQYEEFEEAQVLALDTGEDITAINAVALSIKLTQFANGAVYDANLKYHEVHSGKLDALKELHETAQGQSMLVFYWFKHDLERLCRTFPKARILKTKQDIDDWNAGKIDMAFAHPASAGHGLNLQEGGSISVWFGLTWDLQLYQQANKRLHRQGQKKTVIIHHLAVPGTMDMDILRAIEMKAMGQNALMEAVKARVDKFKSEPV